jgi:hypothetical protein
MRHVASFPALALVPILAASCATTPVVDRPLPEFVYYDYDFDGLVGSRGVNGNVRFRSYDEQSIAYTVSSQHGTCSGYLHRAYVRRVRLRCDALSFEFVSGGRVRTHAPATLVIAELVPRRECVAWRVTEAGQTVCARWDVVLVEHRVSRCGTIQIKRVDPTGWTG